MQYPPASIAHRHPDLVEDQSPGSAPGRRDDPGNIAAMPVASVSVARPRPPHPDFYPASPPRRKGIVGSLRRGMRRLANAAVDGGWFRLQPLRFHVVICGFPRSGTTLLQLILGTCVSDVRTFPCEIPAQLAAFAVRNHSYMVTKTPKDVFYIDEIRAFYATRAADARFIINVRDPRAVLTSIHMTPTKEPDGYWMNPRQWRSYYDHVCYAQQFDDVLTVKYNDLVSHAAAVQQGLTEFIGWHVHLSFDQFYTAAPPEFDRTPLNGLRPLDPSRLESWRQEKHRARIRRILREIPELPECLIEMGYESDTSWVRDYC